MKRCCTDRTGGGSGKLDTSGWLMSGGLLLLIPKCPVCLAGYIAAFTGLGLSVQVASGLRWLLLTLCLASLALLSCRLVRRFLGCSASAEVTGKELRNESNSP